MPGLKVITAPTVEPVTLAEAKLHLRVDASDEDALISRLISAARERCEQITQRAVAQQTLQLLLDDFPADAIELLMPPVASIDWVKYIDTTGTEQTISAANYGVDDGQVQHWLLPAYGYSWPTPRAQANAVRVQYQAGWSAASCPPSVKEWLLRAIGTMYAFREDAGEKPMLPKDFVRHLLDRWMVPTL